MDEELAMTEAEWERYDAEQPGPQPDPPEEPAEPWARDETGEWKGWRSGYRGWTP